MPGTLTAPESTKSRPASSLEHAPLEPELGLRTEEIHSIPVSEAELRAFSGVAGAPTEHFYPADRVEVDLASGKVPLADESLSALARVEEFKHEASDRFASVLDKAENNRREAILTPLKNEYENQFLDFYRNKDNDSKIGLHIGRTTLEAFDRVFDPARRELDGSPLGELAQEFRYHVHDQNLVRIFTQGCDRLQRRLETEVGPKLLEAVAPLEQPRRRLEAHFGLGAMTALEDIAERVDALRGESPVSENERTRIAEEVQAKFEAIVYYATAFLRQREFSALTSEEKKELRAVFKSIEEKAKELKTEFNELVNAPQTPLEPKGSPLSREELTPKEINRYSFPIRDADKEIRLVQKDGNTYLEITAAVPHGAGRLGLASQRAQLMVQVGDSKTSKEQSERIISETLSAVKELKEDKIFSADGRKLNVDSELFKRILSFENGSKLAELRNMEVHDLNVSGVDLSGLKVSNAKLVNFVAIDANLKGAVFERVTARNSNFERANLEGADFKKSCTLDGSNFFKANLNDASLKCSVKNCVALGASLRGTSFAMNDAWFPSLAAIRHMRGFTFDASNTGNKALLGVSRQLSDVAPFMNMRLNISEFSNVISTHKAIETQKIEGPDGKEAILVTIGQRMLLIQGNPQLSPSSHHEGYLWSVQVGADGKLKKKENGDELDALINTDDEVQEVDDILHDLFLIARHEEDSILKSGHLTHETYSPYKPAKV